LIRNAFEKLHTLCFSPNIVRAIELGRIGRARRDASLMGEVRNANEIFAGNSEASEDLDIDGRIILK
jgi:hypothetical protein